ncbi:MAG: DUF4124 domain-containing protein [Halopseudomonas sp.]|uniref:DUF4124 domain-containing protein n=1 Tax=Halopseudomonas sp. TaxID=2901191 RepID=UPI0030030BD2
MPAFKRMMSGTVLAVAALGSGLAQADLYRYIDDKGVTVLDSRVPPQFISRGYEVLDSQGRVKLVVPAAPTAAEREATRAALAAQKEQETADANLLRLYGSTADLERARSRQIQQIENQIAASKASIGDLQVEREELQSRAAQAERAGREVDPDVLSELAAVDSETARLQRLISRKRQEIVESNADFDRQSERLDYLVGDDD